MGVHFMFFDQRDQIKQKGAPRLNMTKGEMKLRFLRAFVEEKEMMQMAVHVRDFRFSEQGYAFQCTDRVMIY